MNRKPTVIKRHMARAAREPVVTGEGAGNQQRAADRGRGGPVVNVRRNGDLVEALEVTCPCGHTMVIECLYDARRAETTP